MNNNIYEVGTQIRYTTTKINGEYVPDRPAHTLFGYVVKTHYDGSVLVVDEHDEYHMIDEEQILERVYDPAPLAGLIIELLEHVMSLEKWLLLTLTTGVVIGIVKHIVGSLL